jgi:hypothetical protein
MLCPSLFRLPVSCSERELDLDKDLPQQRRTVLALLEQAGLELWQAPEGFWAIRLRSEGAVALAARPRCRARPR